jgi:surface glycoprotein (TIGR04207 family)/PGF-CTERM protein
MTSNTEKFRGLFLAALMVFSVFAGSVAFAGSAAAANTADGDAELSDGGTYWQGQSVFAEYSNFDNLSSGDDYEIRDSESGELVRQRTADSEGPGTLIETSGLDGTYDLTQSGDQVATFEVAVQDFNVSANDGEVNVAGDDTNETFDIESNRGSFTVNVSETDGDIDASDLETAFADEDATAVGDNVQIQVSGGTSIEGDFGDVSAGEYTLDFEVNDTDAEDSVNLNLSEDTGEAQFSQAVVTQNAGDVAEITVELENSDQAAVTIGDIESDGYQANATVTDEDGDGEVTLRFNSFTAGAANESNVSSFIVNAAGDDTAELENQTELSAPLANTTYDMTVRSGSDVGAGASDVATLNLRSRSTDEMTIVTAPGGVTPADASELVGVVSDDNTVAEGDWIVHELEASGLEGAAAEAGGLLGVLGDNVSLTIEQDRQRPNREPRSVDLSAADPLVFPDSQNDSYYIVLDSDGLQDEDGNDISVDDGSYTTTFTIGEDSPLAAGGDEEVSGSFELAERGASVQPPEVEASAGQAIQGQSSLAAGSEVTIRVQSQSSANPFLLEQRATVQDNGTFSADFDFSEAEEGTNFTVDVRQGGESLLDEAQTGTVGEAPTASVSYSGGINDNGSVVTVDEVFLPNGGFVTVHDETLVSEDDAFGSVLGTSEYLDAGSHSDVEVELDSALNESQTLIPMAHQDTNDNEEYDFVDSEGEDDGPYTDNDEAVIDSAEVEVGDGGGGTTTEDNETTTTTTTTTEDNGTTTTEEPSDGDGDGGSDNDGGQPGFGISVAIVALIAAALLALRRQD